ncbi:MAG: GNAT family N-acetyltransferase [Firmicutes bacterium]|nr:GNAT family N-acetyltransferase [Bacillota bacterium]
MTEFHPIETERLLLRRFSLDDAQDVQRLAGDWDIARMTINIPHPYEDGVAEEWISRQREPFDRGEVIALAATLKPEGTFIGCVSLGVNKKNHWAELGYWIGKPHWNKGYCTEAAGALMDYGFRVLELNRIQARHLASNPASGRVMQKLGMSYEGTLRQVVFLRGSYEDLAVYAILRDENDV